MKQFTQEQIDQGDAYGMTAGEDYELIQVEASADDEDDDFGPMDVDRSGIGIPAPESDGGKPKASASQEDDKSKSDGGEDDGKDAGEESDDKDASAEGGAGDEASAAGSDDDDGSDADADGDDDSKLSIPKYRYDQQRDRAQRLETEAQQLRDRIAAMETGQAPAAAAEPAKPAEPEGPTREQQLLEERVDSLLEQKNSALIDGDAKEAAKLERELMKTMREMDALSAPKPEPKQDFDPVAERDRIKAEVREEAALDDTIDSLIEEYEVLDDTSDSYDQKVVDRIARLQRVYMDEGMAASEALVEASEALLAGQVSRSAAQAAKPAEKPAEKRKTDVKKNVETARKQPASLDSDLGSDSDSAGLNDDLPDIDNISDEEFDKLPKHIQDRMAGNVLTH